MNVELVHEPGCPHVEAAREALRRAFELAGLTPAWTEWDASDPEAPAHARGRGSPTILVGGRDVVPAPPTGGAGACRVYRDANGRPRPAPPPERIAERLRAAAVARDGP